jgi:O-antigen/teichoic acid export membrane protein
MISNLSQTSRQLLTWIGIDRETVLGKFGQDVLWNVASFGIMATCGIGINLIIGRWYSPDVLGIFNQTYAIFVIASQFAVAGIHLSVVKYVAQYSDNADIYRPMNSAALILAALFAGISCAALGLFSNQIGRLFGSPGVAKGITYIVPGLFFFSINKILLSILNGLSRMRVYAVYQSLRYIMIIASLLIIAVLQMPGESLMLSFSMAELIIFVAMLPVIFREIALPPINTLRNYLRIHLNFGMRSFLSNVFLQTNNRVDILILGLFWSDHTVGIYSFAAILVDGIFQLPVVLRTNYNPVLVRLISENQLQGLITTVSKGVRITYAAMLVICLSALIFFPLGALVVSHSADYLKSWPILAILLTGLTLGSGYIPFSNILLQAGRPGLHTIMVGFWVLSNLLLNMLLVPRYGIWGAAVATALAYTLLAVFVKVSTWGVLKVRI